MVRAGVLSVLARQPSIAVAAVGSSSRVVQACGRGAPDVVLLAPDLPPDGGLVTVEHVMAVAPAVRIVEHVIGELQEGERSGRARLDLAGLSLREREVLALLSAGHPNHAIALPLGISAFTVKRHVHTILRKLQLPSRAAAAPLSGSMHASHQRPTDVALRRAASPGTPWRRRGEADAG